MPVYNAGQFLKEAAGSVLSQSLRELELICVDDCSDDASLEILTSIAERDERLKIVKNKKRSYAGIARNAGMDAASGEYLAFLDADDLMEPDCLEHQYRLAKKHDADYIRSLGKFCDSETGEVSNDIFIGFGDADPEYIDTPLCIFDSPEIAALLVNTEVVPWASLFKRSFVEEHGIRFNGLFCVNDCSFQRIVLLKAKRCVLDPFKAVIYRINNDASLIGKKAEHFDCNIKSVELVREQARALPDDLRQLFMRRELLCLHAWYKRLCEYDSVREKTVAYISSFEDDLGAQAINEPWFPDFLEMKMIDGDTRFFGASAADIANIIRANKNLEARLDECSSIEDSYSFRVGRALTKPFRKLRSFRKT